jgi:SAM-dependent methyltransferase
MADNPDMAATAPEVIEFERQVDEVLAGAIATYGVPSSGPIFENMRRALMDPSMHDFRMDDLPGLTGDASLGARPLRILDLGCGPGTLVFSALRRGHDAYGIDLDEQKIALGQAWARALGYAPEWLERLQLADAGALPFPDETFDVVSSYHVLEHVHDLRSVLYEAVRVTKRGGWLALRAPDYRMSYDTHYCMPWPRFMPAAQSKRWAEAMGRPASGVGSFYYVTAPEVLSIVRAMGCRVQTCVLREHRDGAIHPHSGVIPSDPIVFPANADVGALAAELKALDARGQLPAIYKTCLEFDIAAQRQT